MSWCECVVDKDYEIFTEFPYPIRRIGSNKIIKECLDSYGYVICSLNGKQYKKHRVAAIQFLPNPNNLPYIDHVDRNRANNHISNLRWCSVAENNRNKSSNNGVEYEFVDKISDDAIEITDYGNHHFEFYFYVEANDSFYYYTGVNYRKLHINFMKNGSAYISAFNIENKKTAIYLNKFKRLYGIEF